MLDILRQSKQYDDNDSVNKIYTKWVNKYLKQGYEVLQEFDDSITLIRDDDDIITIQIVYWCDGGKYSIIVSKASDIDLLDTIDIM